MLMRFDPMRELDRLTEGRGRPAFGAMDAYRTGDRFLVELDLPGVDPASVELTLDADVLTVRAERSPGRGDGAELVVSERPQGSVSRQLFLGEGLDPENIQASYDRGVLTVTIPVAEKARPRRVEIATGPSAPTSIDASSSAA